ncbi:hypothetical protein [Streptomyces tritici]|uniref:hypothetical protein n=1 Tax=Streptomyces tritici TaxID=2054410 RepID=UPI003AEF3287
MDEMKTLQDFRAGAPAPDRARLEQGRRRLLEAAAPREPSWSSRLRWKVLAPAAAALVTAAAVLTTQLTAEFKDRSQGPMSVGVATSLEDLADRLEKGLPEDGIRSVDDRQWVYREEVFAGTGVDRIALKHVLASDMCAYPEHLHVQRIEFWDLGDSTKRAVRSERAGQCGKKDRKLQMINTPAYREPEMRQRGFAAKAPTDPEALLRAVRSGERPQGTRQQITDFRALVGLLRGPVGVTPRLRATVLRALADLPGAVVSDRPVRDVLNRPVLTVGMVDPTNPNGAAVRNEVLIDAATGAYRGMQQVATVTTKLDVLKKGDRLGPQVRAGQVIESWVTVRTAVVDKPGERRG